MGFSQFFTYISTAIGMHTGGIIYSVTPQLPFLLILIAIVSSFLFVLFMVHEPEERDGPEFGTDVTFLSGLVCLNLVRSLLFTV